MDIAGQQAIRLRRHEIIAYLGLAFVVMLLDCAGLFLYATKYGSARVAVIMHVMALVAVMACAYWSRREGGDFRLWAFLALMVIVAGPAGALSGFLAGGFYAFQARASVAFAEWFAAMFPEERARESGKLYERIVFGLDDMPEVRDVEPFRDVMRYGSFQQKQDVLVKISRYFRPEFAPVLLQALRDKDTAIRVQAAGAIADIEREYLQRTIELERQVAKHQNIEMMLKFAALCNEYAHSGILDAEREQQSREKAITNYRRCLRLRADDIATRCALGMLYLRNNESIRAAKELERCLDKKSAHFVPALQGYMEALFRMGDLAKLRAVAKRYHAEFSRLKSVEGEPLRSVLEAWRCGLDKENLLLEQRA